MQGSLILNTELEIKRVDDGKVLRRVVLDIDRIPEDELLWMIRSFRELKRSVRRRRGNCIEDEVVDEVRRVMRDAESIVNRAVEGGRVKMFAPSILDPALRASPSLLVGAMTAIDIGMWWCDYGATGKYFTENLCTNSYITFYRRGVALNPWSLSTPGDLDTIIDSGGYNKSGSIGTSPFSFSRSSTQTSASILATFVAASTTTISSVLLVAGSYGDSNGTDYCDKYHPAPKGTCHTSYYATIYLPLWGWDVDTQVNAGETYAVKIRFYV